MLATSRPLRGSVVVLKFEVIWIHYFRKRREFLRRHPECNNMKEIGNQI